MVAITKEFPAISYYEERTSANLVELHYFQDAHSLMAKGQLLRVIEGTAWLSLNGDDFILKSGEKLTLSASSYPAVISALGRAKLVYTLVD